MINIDIVNESTNPAVTDGLMKYVVDALQVQVTRDFYPVWGNNAQLNFIPKGSKTNPDNWQLVVLNDSEQAGALGYYELTPAGLPLGKVFVNPTIAVGESWTVCVSHELLEMLADPDVNHGCFIQDGIASGNIYAGEIADAVASDNYSYSIGVPTSTVPNVFHIKVSNFVFPNWFEFTAGAGIGRKYDHMSVVNSPLQLMPGGYIGVFPVPNNGNGWAQVEKAIGSSEVLGTTAKPPQGSRRECRTIPLKTRRRSTYTR
jgi:hypothetical protein